MAPKKLSQQFVCGHVWTLTTYEDHAVKLIFGSALVLIIKRSYPEPVNRKKNGGCLNIIEDNAF